ncbi:MAG TPA: hypothetical protein VK817_10375 [Trebonia sp.]|nr:hypothetical protein [Trebonia sp.]
MTRRPLPIDPAMKWPSRRTDMAHEVSFTASHLRREWVTPADVGRLWAERWRTVVNARTGPFPAWAQRQGLMTQAKRQTRRAHRKGLLERAKLTDVGLKRADHPRSRWAYRVRAVSPD